MSVVKSLQVVSNVSMSKNIPSIARISNSAPTIVQTSLQSSNFKFPRPLPQLISKRIDLIQKLHSFKSSLNTRDLDQSIFEELEILKKQADNVSFGNYFSSDLNDPYWGLHPDMGLVDDSESREFLAAESIEISDVLMREVGQIVELGIQLKTKPKYSVNKTTF